jgi:hypothetical protein
MVKRKLKRRLPSGAEVEDYRKLGKGETKKEIVECSNCKVRLV